MHKGLWGSFGIQTITRGGLNNSLNLKWDIHITNSPSPKVQETSWKKGLKEHQSQWPRRVAREYHLLRMIEPQHLWTHSRCGCLLKTYTRSKQSTQHGQGWGIHQASPLAENNWQLMAPGKRKICFFFQGWGLHQVTHGPVHPTPMHIQEAITGLSGL